MKRGNKNSGGVLIVVLAVILVAGAVTAGWIMTMTSEVEYVAQFSQSAQRRIGAENASAMVRQHLLTSVLTKTDSIGTSADIGGGWGAVTIPNSVGTPLTTFDQAAGYNHFNPGNGGGYALDPYNLTVTMTAGGESLSRRFLVKSRSSVLSGTLAAFHAPTASVSGSLSVDGQSLLWLSSASSSLSSVAYAVPAIPSTSLIGESGSAIPASNFPFVPMTGSEVSGLPAFDGTLNVIANNSGINSMAVMSTTSALNGRQVVNGSESSNSNGVISDGSGKVAIDLLDPALGNVVVEGETTHLILKGQTSEADRTAAGNAAAVLVLVYQTNPPTNLTEVEFQNTNWRKLVLAIQTLSGTGTTFNFPQAGVGSWRVVLTLENTPVTFQLYGASQSLVGGLQTDHPLVISNGTLNLFPESDPKLLDRLTARDGWVEVYAP